MNLTERLRPLQSGFAGMIVGLDITLRSAALAMLFFTGALHGGAADGVNLFIFASLIMTAIGIWRLGVPTGLTVVQSEAITVLLPTVAIISAAQIDALRAEATGFAVLGLTAALTCLSFWLVASLRLDRFARLVPYAVVVGFLAGIGVLLMQAALRDMVPVLFSPDWHTLSQADGLKLMLTLGTAALIWSAKRMLGGRGMILALLIVPAGFYAWMLLSGTSWSQAQALGLLSPAIPQGGNLLAHLGFWEQVDWGLVRQSLPLMAAAVVVSILALLMTISGVEVILREDVPTTRVFKSSAGFNALAGLFGGGPGYVSIASVGIAKSVGKQTRLIGYAACAVLALGAYQSEAVIAFTPRFLTAGLLFYIGFGLLWDWLLGQFFRMSRTDWAISLGIVATTLLFGILSAVVLGILAAAMIFVVNYARLPVIRRMETLETRRSAVDRDPLQTRQLDQEGHKVSILSLQGFLFFGSADRLVSRIRSLLADHPETGVIILDCRQVSGIDAAASQAFSKLDFLAIREDVDILISNANRDMVDALNMSGALGTAQKIRLVQASTDQTIEQVEDRLLQGAAETENTDMARRTLQAHIPDHDGVEQLLSAMERADIPKGTVLIQQGDTASEMYLVDSGRFSVFVPAPEGGRIRVRSFRAGTFLGEIANYLNQPRTADVIADEDSSVYRITADILDTLETEQPHLAALWHRMLAEALSERIMRTTKLAGDLSG